MSGLAAVGSFLAGLFGRASAAFAERVRLAGHVAFAPDGNARLPLALQEALKSVEFELQRQSLVTDTVDQFLRSLFVDRLITQILLETFYRRPRAEVEVAFLALYDKYHPSRPDDARRLLEAVREAARKYLDWRLRDKPEYFLLTESLRELEEIRISSRRVKEEKQLLLENYDARERDFEREMAAARPLVTIEFNEAEETHVQAIRRLYPWFFIPDVLVVEVHERYVRKILEETRESYLFGPRGARVAATFDDTYLLPDLQPVPLSDLTDEEVTAESFGGSLDLLRPLKPIVVLGHPGCGKTSVGRYIARQLARDVDDRRFPILLELRKYIAARKTGYSLLQFAMDVLISHVPEVDSDVVKQACNYAAFAGRAYFIFDGLDEILDIDQRLSVRREIEAFHSTHPNSCHIVTSREVGYSKTVLKSALHYKIPPFGWSEIEAYADKVGANVLKLAGEERTQFTSRFLEQVRERARELAGIPLLLSLMIVIYHDRGHELPDQRQGIYLECAKLLFITWDDARQIDPNLPDRFRITQLLVRLAQKIYTSQELQAGVSHKWLVRECSEFFLRVFGSDEALAAAVGEKFTDYITDRAWVFTLTGVDTYEFTHRTFMEYYFSVHLGETHEALHALLEVLKPRILKGQWWVPSHLCLQKWVEDSFAKSNRLARELLIMLDDAAGSEATSFAFNFVSEAVDYLLPGDNELIDITEALTVRAHNTSSWRASLYRTLRRANQFPRGIYEGVRRGLLKNTAGEVATSSVADFLYAVRLYRRGIVELDFEIPTEIVELSEFIEERGPEEWTKTGIIPTDIRQKLIYDVAGVLPDSADPSRETFWTTASKRNLRADWTGVDACALLIEFASKRFTSSDARLLQGLGRLAFEGDDRIAFSDDRSMLSGPLRGLKQALWKRTISAVPIDLLQGYFAALCIIDDYNYSARQRGRPLLSAEIEDRDLDTALDQCVERYLAAFPDAPDRARWRALARRSPKLIPEPRNAARSLADLLREPGVAYS